MPGQVRVDLFEAGADAERHIELVHLMREELLQLDVRDVRPAATGSVPEGARGVDAAQVTGLFVALGHAATGLSAVIATVRTWLARGTATRSVRLEIDGDVLEITRATKAHETRLVDLFIGRHTTEAG